MNKLFFVISALGCTSVAFANGFVPEPYIETNVNTNYFDGFYVGAGADMQHSSADINNTISTSAPISGSLNTLNHSNSDELGSTNFGGDINIGFGKTFNTTYSRYYAGLELYTRYVYDNPTSSASSSAQIATTPLTNITSDVKIKNDFSYGGALKLGYLFNPKTMFYILAGVEYTRLDSEVIQSGEVELIPLPSANFSYTNDLFAFTPGVGLETMFTDNLSLKAEYKYLDYPSVNNKGNASKTVSFAGNTLTSTVANDQTIDLSRGIFSLGLTYYFNNV